MAFGFDIDNRFLERPILFDASIGDDVESGNKFGAKEDDNMSDDEDFDPINADPFVKTADRGDVGGAIRVIWRGDIRGGDVAKSDREERSGEINEIGFCTATAEMQADSSDADDADDGPDDRTSLEGGL